MKTAKDFSKYSIVLVAIMAVGLSLNACSPSSSNNPETANAPPANGGDTNQQTSLEPFTIGSGTRSCPLPLNAESYRVRVPDNFIALQSIPQDRYVLTSIRTERVELVGESKWELASGTKIVPNVPGQIQKSDTIQALVQNPLVPVLPENLNVPTSFESVNVDALKREIVWGNFVNLVPDLDLHAPGRIGNHKIQFLNPKVFDEPVEKSVFNVFKKYSRHGYQKTVQWSDTSAGLVVGRVVIEKRSGSTVAISQVRLYLYLQNTNGTQGVVDTRIELTFKPEKQATSSCRNASAIRVVPKTTNL